MKWVKKLNVLQYSIFSYILFFSLIFIPMSLVWYATSKHSVTQQIELSSKNLFLQAKSNFESNLSQLDLISQQLPHDSLVSLEKLSDPFDSIKGRLALAKYRVNSSFIEQIYLFYPEQPEMIFSPSGSTKVDILLNAKQAKLNNQDFLNIVNLTSPSFYTLETENGLEKAFFYVVPTQDSFGINNATMIYVVRKSSIDDLFLALSADNQEKFFLMNKQTKKLNFASEDSEFINQVTHKTIKNKELPTTLKWDDKTFLLHLAENDTLNLTYLYAVNTNPAMTQLTKVYGLSVLVLVIVLIIGIFSSIFLGKQSYRPYKNIESLLLKYHSNDEKKQKLSFEDIQKTVSNFILENSYLKREMAEHEPYIQESLLHQLLTGQLTDEQNMTRLLSSSLANQQNICYFSIVISLEAINNENELKRDLFDQHLLQKLNQKHFPLFKCFGIKLLEKDAITFLILSPHMLSQKEVVEKIAKLVVKTCGISLPIGVGAVKTDLQGIKHSFIEALTAVDYRYTEQKNNIIFFESITKLSENHFTSFHFPEDQQLKLIQSLKLGNETVSLDTLNDLISYGVEYCQNVQMFQMYSYYIINTFAQVGTATLGDTLFTKLEPVIEAKNYQQLELQLQSITQLICSSVESHVLNENTGGNIKEQLFKYIAENYHKDSLSLEFISDYFDLTATTINKIMKEETDTTFAKYIADLRLNKIKADLIETDLSIKEIIQRNGYYDVSNFTRKFRTIVGVTPGKYRTMHQDDYLSNT